MVAPPAATSRSPFRLSSEDPGGTNCRNAVDTMRSPTLWMEAVVMASRARRIGTLGSRSPVIIWALSQAPRPDTLLSAQPLRGLSACGNERSAFSCPAKRAATSLRRTRQKFRRVLPVAAFPAEERCLARYGRVHDSPSQARAFPMKTCCFQDRRAHSIAAGKSCRRPP